MSSHRPTSAGTSSRGGDCEECVRMKKRGHKNAKEPKYCDRHQCKDLDSTGVMCTNRIKTAEIRCSKHAKCNEPRCPNPRSTDPQGVLNDYCYDHQCPVTNCNEGKAHDPGRNFYDRFCATHMSSKCGIPKCLNWRAEPTRYCDSHLCTEDCINKVVSESRPFCLDHNVCRIQGCTKERCQFGNQFEFDCLEHFIPPCRTTACTQKSSSPSPYCETHVCQHRKCLKEARPGRGKPFCVDHKCSDNDCQLLRTFNEVDKALRKNSFCVFHECKSDDCVKHNVPNKLYCNSHYCTAQNCTSPRDSDPRFASLCHAHYESRIRDAAIAAERRRNEELAEREAMAEAQAHAEEVHREEILRERAHREEVHREEARRTEELRRQQQQRMPHRPREEQQPHRRQDIPRSERREMPRQEIYEDPYVDDEGYRSRPASGTYGWTR